MVDKTLEELTRDQLREELRVRNQPVGGSKEQLNERLTKCLKEEGLNQATETFEVEDAKLTPDPLSQILEKLAAADNLCQLDCHSQPTEGALGCNNCQGRPTECQGRPTEYSDNFE